MIDAFDVSTIRLDRALVRGARRARKAYAHTVALKASAETDKARKRHNRAERGARRAYREALWLVDGLEG